MPTGLRWYAAVSAAAVGDTMSPVTPVSTLGRAVHGSLSVSVAVSGSTTSIAVSGMRTDPLYGDAFCRSRLNFTAAASNGVPSWNVMPSFSVNVQLNRSSDSVRASARSGCGVPSSGVIEKRVS